MSRRPSSGSWWRDPEYVATLTAVVSTGALFFYSGLVEGAPPPETVGFVLLWVVGPSAVAYELGRRFP